MTTIYTIGCPEVEKKVAAFATWGGGEGRWSWTVQDKEEGYLLLREGNHWTIRPVAQNI